VLASKRYLILQIQIAIEFRFAENGGVYHGDTGSTRLVF